MGWKIPANLRYTTEHEWARLDGSIAVCGISDYAQDALGDITYIELPEQGREIQQGESLAIIETVKATTDVYAPVSGTVVEVNYGLEEQPELVNKDPYGKGWIVKIEMSNPDEFEELLVAAAYVEHVRAEADKASE